MYLLFTLIELIDKQPLPVELWTSNRSLVHMSERRYDRGRRMLMYIQDSGYESIELPM